MDYQNLTDDELQTQIYATRVKLDQYEDQLSQTDNSVDKAKMRSEMTHLNHLKVEANRRGLNINGLQ